MQKAKLGDFGLSQRYVIGFKVKLSKITVGQVVQQTSELYYNLNDMLY